MKNVPFSNDTQLDIVLMALRLFKHQTWAYGEATVSEWQIDETIAIVKSMKDTDDQRVDAPER